MERSSRSDYAMLAVYELSLAYGTNRPVSAHKIADKYSLSANFLLQILQQLRKAKLVTTVRGAQGGFRLLSKPEEITLGYVVALAEESSPTTVKTPQKLKESVPPQDVEKRSQRKGRSSKATPDPSLMVRDKLDKIWARAEAKRQEYLNGVLFSELISKSDDDQTLSFMI